MKVQRLAIIGVMGNDTTRNKETEEGAWALLGKYQQRSPDMPYTLQFVQLGTTRDADDWLPAEDQVLPRGMAMDFPHKPGVLGVYVLAHGSLAGLDGVVDEAKFHAMLKHFKLLSVSKLCLVACCGALEGFVQGHVVGNPSVLRRLCEHLGSKGCTPKMAEWSAFVTVVNDSLFRKVKEDNTKPMALGPYQTKNAKNKILLDPSAHSGRKALNSPSNRSALILSANPLSGKAEQKIYYAYQDGATRITHTDWTQQLF